MVPTIVVRFIGVVILSTIAVNGLTKELMFAIMFTTTVCSLRKNYFVLLWLAMISITVFSWSVLFCGWLCCQLLLCAVFRLICVKGEVHVLVVCYFVHHYFLMFARAVVRVLVIWYTVHYWCSTSDKRVDLFLTWLGVLSIITIWCLPKEWMVLLTFDKRVDLFLTWLSILSIITIWCLPKEWMVLLTFDQRVDLFLTWLGILSTITVCCLPKEWLVLLTFDKRVDLFLTWLGILSTITVCCLPKKWLILCRLMCLNRVGHFCSSWLYCILLLFYIWHTM